MSIKLSIVLISAITILMAFPIAASADIIYEPPDNFYQKHTADCVHLDRYFYANGDAGYILLKNEPGSSNEVAAFVNGTVFRVSFTYLLNGAQWGVLSFDAAADGQNGGTGASSVTGTDIGTGWVPMSELVIVYDYISFEDDHGGEIYAYTGDSPSGLLENMDFVFWTWPGSGEVASIRRTSVGTHYSESERIWLTIERAYKDPEGREWGFVPYFYSDRERWICISDPTNTDIPAFNPAPKPQLHPPIDPGSLPRPRNGGTRGSVGVSTTTLIIIIAMVAAVTIGTAVLIKILWKPKDVK